MLPQRLHHRSRAWTTCWRTDLRRLRFAPWLAQQIHCTLDRIRDHALRCAGYADRRAQEPHIRRGGAAHRPQPALNSNFNFNWAPRTPIKMRSTDIFTSKYLKSADVKTKPEIAVISYLVTEVVG